MMEATIAAYRESLVRNLIARDVTGLFSFPMDVVALGIPHYRTVVKRPIDLQTIQNRVRMGEYGCGWAGSSIAEVLCWDNDAAFFEDITRIYTNAILFFGPESIVHKTARQTLPYVAAEREKARGAIAAVREVIEAEAIESEEEEEEAYAEEIIAPKEVEEEKQKVKHTPYYILQAMGRVLPTLPPSTMLSVAQCIKADAAPGDELEFNLDELDAETQAKIRSVLDSDKIKY